MNKTGMWLTLILLSIFYIVAFIFYPQMPGQMASHWNAQGVVDGYTSKFLGVFLFPFIATGLALLFIAIPAIDPLKSNIQKFRKYYDWFVVLFLLFLQYIYVLTLLWNKNASFDMIQAFLPAMGILFFYIGIMVQNAKRNYMVGIRTPWTLANEEVWDKTHRLGGKLFMGAGVLAALGAIWPKYALVFILVPVLAVTLVTMIYSYANYRNTGKTG
jgi:uncharacterized membrane protein